MARYWRFRQSNKAPTALARLRKRPGRKRLSKKTRKIIQGRLFRRFFTNPVDLPEMPRGTKVGTIWMEERGDYLYPWRVTGVRVGYPIGEPVRKGTVR